MSNTRYPEWQAEAAEALIAPIMASEPGQVSAHMRQFWTSEMLKTLSEIAAVTLDLLSEDVHSALQSL